MTIDEIKGLVKFLTDEDIEEIKNQIKSKEKVLKEGKAEEEEMNKVLNALFAILVLEKTLELEIEDLDDIRQEIEEELLEAYQIYDSYMIKCKTEEKKKKKRWLLDFLFMSENIHAKKQSLGASKKEIERLKRELDDARYQRRDDRLQDILKSKKDREEFCKYPKECKNPHHNHDRELQEKLARKRYERLCRDIDRALNTRPNAIKYRENLLKNEEIIEVKMEYDSGISVRKSR